MKRSSQSFHPTADSSPSTSSTTSTTSSNLSTSIPSSSAPEIPHQQNHIQYVVLQNRDALIQALTQSYGNLKNLHLIRIHLDDDLIWRIVESSLERVLLQNCDFCTDGFTGFVHLFKFLVGENSLENCFRFSVQSNDSTT